ncbi:hypothetical protein TTHERM_00593040 (macronuclear) [Tetrahymena thermophila SB210]|uniref:Transmembrane protein n=1 Tax=Tetrahymena thermophila (strain SB210) TaxID=312017 RepID=Q232J4_TETTS|nr:hypothetical protein TTHERM_00593040 [Tetrahymena thermophila SB210]EAR91418.1 hypothetical protein TTHERM_00593040 [Tetrahymena thermophila SB210]|eukprot:XP_001011663.1 hypothetical protein TTHERM_00593040 [Tetrahymena thermophila SB210]
MKILISFAVLLAIASCQVYIMNVGNQCSQQGCPQSIFLKYANSFICPDSGKNSAILFTNDGVNYIIKFPYNFIALNLQKIDDPSSNGIQYISKMQTSDSFVIFNCTIPAAQQYTDLCSNHDFVGGKMSSNGIFFKQCAFSMDILQEEKVTL